MSPGSSSGGDWEIDGELLEMIADAEAKVGKLRAELERRRRYRDEAVEQSAQHAEIVRLAEYLDQARIDWQHVREFFQSALDESQTGQLWGEKAPGEQQDRDPRDQ